MISLVMRLDMRSIIAVRRVYIRLGAVLLPLYLAVCCLLDAVLARCCITDAAPARSHFAAGL